MAAYIFLKDIGKKNKNDIVIADLSLGLEKGKKLAIVGSNNSGKSMLLRILAGIIKADFGTIFIDGKEFLSNSKEIKKTICYIPEHNDFYSDLSIYDNLFIYIKMFSELSSGEARKIILNWADIFNFSDVLYLESCKVRSSKLRIISLARAFIQQPDILIMDQPTKNLDIENQSLFWSKAKSVLKNTTVIYSSYDFSEIEKYSDRISFLDRGKIRLNGSVEQIMNQTESYSYYRIIFKDFVDKGFSRILKESSHCYHLSINHNQIEFYSPNKIESVGLIKKAFEWDVLDFQERPFDFKDIFLTQTKSNL
tara:strand:- start:1714 stop:2640 length:927 start_codon:yes stop_codon:yes gene_type:complete